MFNLYIYHEKIAVCPLPYTCRSTTVTVRPEFSCLRPEILRLPLHLLPANTPSFTPSLGQFTLRPITPISIPAGTEERYFKWGG